MKKVIEALASTPAKMVYLALAFSIFLFFALAKITYPSSAYFAAFTVFIAALLVIPLGLRLSREEHQEHKTGQE